MKNNGNASANRALQQDKIREKDCRNPPV